MLLFKPAFWLLFQWLPIKCLVTRISLDLWPKRTKCRYNCAESWYQIFCHADDFISPGSLKLGDSSASLSHPWFGYLPLRITNNGPNTRSQFKMNTDQILDVPDTCPICGHQLVGNESICPKCGHCVICQRPQHSRSAPHSQLQGRRPWGGYVTFCYEPDL